MLEPGRWKTPSFRTNSAVSSKGCLPTVDAAELLLTAYRDPAVALKPGKEPEALRAAGLLDNERRYRPASEELARHVATLAQAYEQRPVTLVRLIYALRDHKIRSFAEAFKLRKK